MKNSTSYQKIPQVIIRIFFVVCRQSRWSKYAVDVDPVGDVDPVFEVDPVKVGPVVEVDPVLEVDPSK